MPSPTESSALNPEDIIALVTDLEAEAMSTIAILRDTQLQITAIHSSSGLSPEQIHRINELLDKIDKDLSVAIGLADKINLIMQGK